MGKYGNVVLTSSGRGAISLLLDQVNPKVKKALVPSYICDSVILPFEKFGYELIYYDMDKYFNPAQVNVDSIEIGIFLHMGYFGFPTNEILSDTISKLRAKSVIIVEDVTQTFFSNYENRKYNDFVVGSIRKWFGIPSGGFLASDKNISIELPYPPDDFIDLRISSLQQKYEYIRTQDKSLKDGYLEGFKKAEQLLDKDVNSYRIDEMSERIIECLDVKRLEKIRRENFGYLLKHLKKVSGVEVVFRNINHGVTPMFFPIYVNNNRDCLRNGLISKEIYCPIHWPVPNQLKGRLSSEMKNIYDSILSIPCDQRYGIDDMKRIIDTIKELV
jgi:dTDP-4-amino-4,6-dideoxygalactose transaminase